MALIDSIAARDFGDICYGLLRRELDYAALRVEGWWRVTKGTLYLG